jgi:hypothetical protein
MGVYVHSSGFLFAVQLNIIRNGDWMLPCLILNQYNNKIPKAINTITNYRKPISATYTRTKTRHKHRGICCLLSLVKTCLTYYSIILNLTTVNVPRIENIIFFNLLKKTVAFHCGKQQIPRCLWRVFVIVYVAEIGFR